MTELTSSQERAALAAICLSALMLGLEISSVPSSLPTLENVLPADFRQLQWIMNAYTIAMTASLMAAGTLADRFGRKRIFMGGIGLFGFASLACGLAGSAPILIAARVLQGVSGAAMLACQIAILSHQFRDGPGRGRAFACWGIVFGVGLGFGPLVGGLTVTFAGWEWVFLVHGLLAVVTLWLARYGVMASSDPYAVRIDLPGMATLSLSVFCLVFLITRGKAPGADDPFGAALALLGAASALVFVAVETRITRPMFDFGAFRVRAFSGAIVGSAGMNFSFWPFVIYLPIQFHAGYGLDPATAGLALLAYTLPTLMVPSFAERLLRRRGPAVVIPLGLLTIGIGFLTMRAGATSGGSWWTLLPGCLVAGAGLGLTNTPVTNTATAALPAERAGMASGMDVSARMIALALNIAVMGALLLRGIRASLERLAPLGDGGLRETLAEAIAAGNLATAETDGIGAGLARKALAEGFDGVMLYGALCALGAAGLSLLAFGRRGTVPA